MIFTVKPTASPMSSGVNQGKTSLVPKPQGSVPCGAAFSWICIYLHTSTVCTAKHLCENLLNLLNNLPADGFIVSCGWWRAGGLRAGVSARISAPSCRWLSGTEAGCHPVTCHSLTRCDTDSSSVRRPSSWGSRKGLINTSDFEGWVPCENITADRQTGFRVWGLGPHRHWGGENHQQNLCFHL